MISSLDHIILAVEDLKDAEKNYKNILGIEPSWRGLHKELGTANVIFNFKNTYLELLSAEGEGVGADLVKESIKKNGEGLAGIVLNTKDMSKASKRLKDLGFLVGDILTGEGKNKDTNDIRNWKYLFLPQELTRNLFLFLIEHTKGILPQDEKFPPGSINKLDHVVINTNDADGFINIYQDIFNIRLALDRIIEHWKSRMLFFRLNKTTIEVIEKKDRKDPNDSLWGLAWEVESIKDAHERLVSNGVEVTEIKKGLKENTLVATIKSHTHNVPTLLIEHT
jgi:catechol 2,3-dioxygenase-like lactoylglutathione lyase family enzyme|tara:strand:- start:14310 stop:15149 length:840 start_codon:yes stop_codon:yes gene_type:complete